MARSDIDLIISHIKAMPSIDRSTVIAVDGFSGAGKSTIASALATRISTVIVPVDDFYTGGTIAEWDARTSEEKYRRGIDWRRLRLEAVAPLLEGVSAEWRPFDWIKGKGLAKEAVRRDPAGAVILDGVYSAGPELSDLVHLSVFVDVSSEVRQRRLIKREGRLGRRFARWDEAERYYFTVVRPASSFDLVVTNLENDET